MEPQTPAQRRSVEGATLVAVSALTFGTLSVFNRHLGQAGVSVPMMLTLRFSGGALVLWGLALVRGEVRRIDPRRWLALVALGALYVAQAWAYFESAARIPVALTALLLYAYPAVVAVAGWLFRRERLGPLGALALGLSSLGIALAVGSPEGPVDSLGVALGLGTALIYTAYILLGARARPDVSALLGSAWLMTIAAGLFALAALGTGSWDLGRCAGYWADVLGLVVLGTAVPIPLLLAGLARIGPTKGSIISSLEPVSAAACGALFLGEGLSVAQLAGGGLVLAALAIETTRGPRTHRS